MKAINGFKYNPQQALYWMVERKEIEKGMPHILSTQFSGSDTS